MTASNQPFSIILAVRDYECDMQGIVNNSVYGNYFEHARHEYLKAVGLSFAALTAEGIHLVVTRSEIDYKKPLVSGDTFTITAMPKLTGKVRGQFIQTITRATQDASQAPETIANAIVHWASITPEGRPIKVQRLHDLFDTSG